MKVAVVDNDADFARSVALLLRARGYEVAVFTCPLEAVSELTRTTPDVLLVDLSMPRLSGIALIRELADGARLPHATVLVTAHTDLVEGMDLGREGIDAFLPKPLDLDALLGTLERLCPAEARLVPQPTDCLC